MKRRFTWFYIVVLCCIMLYTVIPTAHAGLLNEYDDFKEFVNSLSVKTGMFYDAKASDWQMVYAGSIYDFYRGDFVLLSVDAGYSVQDTALVIVDLNIMGLETFGWTLPFGDLRPRVGVGAGYDFRHHEPAYGIATFGFTFGW